MNKCEKESISEILDRDEKNSNKLLFKELY